MYGKERGSDQRKKERKKECIKEKKKEGNRRKDFISFSIRKSTLQNCLINNSILTDISICKNWLLTLSRILCVPSTWLGDSGGVGKWMSLPIW